MAPCDPIPPSPWISHSRFIALQLSPPWELSRWCIGQQSAVLSVWPMSDTHISEDTFGSEKLVLAWVSVSLEQISGICGLKEGDSWLCCNLRLSQEDTGSALTWNLNLHWLSKNCSLTPVTLWAPHHPTHVPPKGSSTTKPNRQLAVSLRPESSLDLILSCLGPLLMETGLRSQFSLSHLPSDLAQEVTTCWLLFSSSQVAPGCQRLTLTYMEALPKGPRDKHTWRLTSDRNTSPPD